VIGTPEPLIVGRATVKTLTLHFIITMLRGESGDILILKMKPIGQLIKEELEKQERSVSWFARKLYLDRSSIYRLFQKNSIDTGLLRRISIVLNKNFFAILSDDYSVTDPDKKQTHS